MAGDLSRSVVDGADEFSRNLLKALSEEVSGNLVCSPMSALLSLGIAQLGAKGETAKAMAAGLSMPCDPLVAQENYKELMQAMALVKEAKLNIAFKAYLKQGFALNQTYQKSLKTFDASIEVIDFLEERAEVVINKWVAEKTKNKIRDLFGRGSFDDNTRLVLVNALYFKGKWHHQFEKSESRKMDFYQMGNIKVKTTFMQQTEKLRYAHCKDLEAKILELPYVGNKLSLVVFLPNEKTGLAKLEEKLASKRMTDLWRMMQMMKCEVYLPKFKIDSTLDLEGPLNEMGMSNMFADSANFSGISNSSEQLSISSVVQKAIIEISEEGTVAAAATRTRKGRTRSRSASRSVTFRAEHPFAFSLILIDAKGPIILFSGRVSILG